MPVPSCQLVTGALGFVGLHLVEHLLGRGLSVVGLDRGSSSVELPAGVGPFRRGVAAAEMPEGVRYESPLGSWLCAPCDLVAEEPVAALVARLRPAVIYHLAAQSSAARSFVDPRATFRANLIGTLGLLEAVRGLPDSDRPTVVAVGSAEEYGAVDAAEGPIREDRPCRPISPYGASKVAQTILCQQYQRAFGLKIVIARPFSHTGPRQDTRFALASFASQIAAAESGRAARELRVGNLAAVRDYLDVRDVVAAYVRLAEAGTPGRVYHVASGRELTIARALEIMLGKARIAIAVRGDPERFRPADIPYLVGDAARLREETGWRAERPLETTLTELLEYARKDES
jgi:GDP-4-dehydro-6-deoxy-D-mannose reductase